MDWFKKLPGYQRTAHGLEWRLWKRLPTALAWGTALPVLAGLFFWFNLPADHNLADDSTAMLTIYKLIGLLAFIWTLLLTVGIGCIIVMVMKGPAYVADGYQHPEREQDKKR